MKGQGIIVFFAVVALFHVMNAESIPLTSVLEPLHDTVRTISDKIESGGKSVLKETERLADGIHSGVATWSSTWPGLIMESNTTEPGQPSALPLKSDADSEDSPAPAVVLPTEEPSA